MHQSWEGSEPNYRHSPHDSVVNLHQRRGCEQLAEVDFANATGAGEKTTPNGHKPVHKYDWLTKPQQEVCSPVWQDQFLHVVGQNKVIDPSTLIPLQEGFLGPTHTYSHVTFYLSKEHLHISWHLQSQQHSSFYPPEGAVTLTDTDAADHSVLVRRVLTQKLTDDVPSKAEAHDHQQCEGVGSFDRVHHCRIFPGTTWIKEDVLSLRCFDVSSSLSDVCDFWWGSSLLCVGQPVATVTVGEQAWRGELQVRQSSQVVKYCAAVTLPLGVIHKGPNVFVLTMVTDSRADHHGNIT